MRRKMRIRSRVLEYNVGTTQTGPSGAGNAISAPDGTPEVTRSPLMPIVYVSSFLVVPPVTCCLALSPTELAVR